MNFNGLFVKASKIINMYPPQNWSGTATTDVYYSMKGYDKVVFIIQTGAWAGGTAAVTLKQATAVAGTNTKALAFAKMFTNAANSPASTQLVDTTVTSNTFNLSVANMIYAVEVKATQLDQANSFDCVCLSVASPGANVDLYGVVAVFYGGRFEELTSLNPAVD